MGEPFNINANWYKAGKLNAITQFQVTRRLLPIMGSLVGIIKMDVALDVETALPAIAEQLAAMPDHDVEFVIKACLAVAQVKVGETGWGPVLANNGMMMNDQMDMMEMLQIVGKVIEENLAGFFVASGQSSKSRAKKSA